MDPTTIFGLVSKIIQSRQRRQVPDDPSSAADTVAPMLDAIDQAQEKRIVALEARAAGAEARVAALEKAFEKLAEELE